MRIVFVGLVLVGGVCGVVVVGGVYGFDYLGLYVG